MCKVSRVLFLLFLVGLGFSMLTISCAPQTPSPAQIKIMEDDMTRLALAVEATRAILDKPQATPTPIPTELPLDGLFCEYGFCIGHPEEIYLIDASTIRNPATPSTRAYGILVAFSPSIFIQVAWTTSGPDFNYSQVQGYIKEEKDQWTGNMDIQLVGDFNIHYQRLNPTNSDKLPYGAIAVWQCGGRDFAWKVYTPQDGMAEGFLAQALARFRCE